MKTVRIAAIVVVVGALAMLTIVKKRSTLPASGYPRSGAYAIVYDVGAPFMTPEGTLDSAAIERLALRDFIIIDPPGGRESPSADVVRLLRARSRAMMFAYLPGALLVCEKGWYNDAPVYGCSDQTMAWAMYQAMLLTGGPVMGKSGRPFSIYGAIVPNFADLRTALALADTLGAWIQNSQAFARAFIDGPADGITWTNGHPDPNVSNRDSIDYRRAGFSSFEAWALAYKLGVHAYERRLRELTGGVVANGRDVAVPDSNLAGEMFERFPYGRNQSVASVLAADTLFKRAGVVNWLTVPRNGRALEDGQLQREWRYAMGTAELADNAVAVFVGSAGDTLRGWIDVWMDEQCVHPSGASVDDPRYLHWLGARRGPARRDSSGAWRRDFEHGLDLVNDRGVTVNVSVEPGYYLIDGMLSPWINTGAAVRVVTIGSQDARFLIKRTSTVR